MDGTGEARGGLRLRVGVDPAGVDAAVQAVRHFRIERAESDEAAERRLDMAAGASEAVIEIEMAERGVEIVAPH